MKITEKLLTDWSQAENSDYHKRVFQGIFGAICGSEFLVEKKVDVYLHGSYPNKTNIRAISDVDIVVQLSAEYHNDAMGVQIHDKQRKNYYSWNFYKLEVLKALEKWVSIDSEELKAMYKVLMHRKCINISNKIDILPALKYKNKAHIKYNDLNIINNNRYAEGIIFWDNDGEEFINYPMLHILNSRLKNSKTNAKYSHFVRILKNFRDYLHSDDTLFMLNCPSYFIDCLVYNYPDELFLDKDYLTNLSLLLYYLRNRISAKDDNLVVVNEQEPLFGKKLTQWNKRDALDFLLSVSELLPSGYDSA